MNDSNSAERFARIADAVTNRLMDAVQTGFEGFMEGAAEVAREIERKKMRESCNAVFAAGFCDGIDFEKRRREERTKNDAYG